MAGIFYVKQIGYKKLYPYLWKPADLKKAVDAVGQYKDELIKAWNEYLDED